jgi:hypothetical protein
MTLPASLVRCAAGLAVALAGAALAQALGIPLPWMLGSLLATAAGKMARLPTQSWGPFRNAGQWVIGTSLGLYFNPTVVALVGVNLPYIAAGMLFALLLGCVGAWLLQRLGHTDFRTAWFASAIGGASEMAVLAERHHARVDLVASAHSLRMLMVVVIIPFAFEFLGFHGTMASQLPTSVTGLHAPGGLLLLVLTITAALLLRRFRVPNAWVLGPLFVTAALTSQNIALTDLPAHTSHIGQLLIGWALGDRFGPDFFHRAPRYLGAVAIVNSINLVLAFGFSYGLSMVSAIPFPTLVLGTSPGGIAEMAITAKVLMLGAPVVTSFHVLRMVFILLVTGPVYSLLRRSDRHQEDTA